MTTTPPTPYRSRAWFDTPELYGWLRRAAFKAEGFGEPAYEGRPIIGICNGHRALDIAQPDIARAGGFTEIRRIAALTSTHGVRLAPHAWGSGILFAASIHMAMAAPNCHILEVSQGYMPMMWELFNEPFDIRPDGTVHTPDRPGLGFTLRPEALWSASNTWMALSTPSDCPTRLFQHFSCVESIAPLQ